MEEKVIETGKQLDFLVPELQDAQAALQCSLDQTADLLATRKP